MYVIEKKTYGFLLFLVGMANTTLQLTVAGNWAAPLWICNFAAIIGGLAIWKKNISLAAAVFFTALVYQTPILIDFVKYLLGYAVGADFTEFFDESMLIFVISIISHAALIPVSLWSIWKEKLSYTSVWYGYFFFGIILFPLSRILGTPGENINCAYAPCNTEFINQATSLEHYFAMFLGYIIILPLMITAWNFFLRKN